MKKSEARERLLDIFFDLDHGPDCLEPDPHFEEATTKRPDRDGCLIIKCWNCHVAQDHFLYEEE